MLLVTCPYCGARPEVEFRCGGEAHVARPGVPSSLDDAAWAEFLFFRKNEKGERAERWIHQHGCQRWFNVLRNTMTDRILCSYAAGEKRPNILPAETKAR
jgi:sarcosine oxidase subunit delta